MDRDLREISSEAERRAQEIMGQADAEATRIYGESYGQDPDFYAFWKTLDSYAALDENTTLMIDADSEFFRYFGDVNGGAAAAGVPAAPAAPAAPPPAE